MVEPPGDVLPPEDAIVIPPELLVIVTFEPAVNVVRVNPVPLPISKAPLAGLLLSLFHHWQQEVFLLRQ